MIESSSEITECIFVHISSSMLPKEIMHVIKRNYRPVSRSLPKHY